MNAGGSSTPMSTTWSFSRTDLESSLSAARLRAEAGHLLAPRAWVMRPSALQHAAAVLAVRPGRSWEQPTLSSNLDPQLGRVVVLGLPVLLVEETSPSLPDGFDLVYGSL